MLDIKFEARLIGEKVYNNKITASRASTKLFDTAFCFIDYNSQLEILHRASLSYLICSHILVSVILSCSCRGIRVEMCICERASEQSAKVTCLMT